MGALESTAGVSHGHPSGRELVTSLGQVWPDVAPPQPSPGGTYVMEGPVSGRSLDTYHLILAPTHACNLRCRHCYLPDHGAECLPRGIALRLIDEWSEIVLKERGPYRGIFHVKGGEPFVVPYLGEIMERLVALGSLRLMLTTNGTFTDPHTMAALARCDEGLDGHLTVIVSVDGASAGTHDGLRGAGHFGVTMDFLRGLRDLRIHTFLNCVLHDGNAHEIPAYLALAQELQVAQVNFLPVVPRGSGLGLRRRQASPVSLHGRVAAVYAAGDDSTRRLLAGSLSHIADRGRSLGLTAAHECVAAYRGLFYITPDGTVFSCPNLISTEHSIGNVRRDSLHTLLARLPGLHATSVPASVFSTNALRTP
jgi:MoaA/NifB/PqqE/SkfB family radical SAM enzyme